MTVTPHFKKIDGFPCSLWNTVLDLGERAEACQTNSNISTGWVKWGVPHCRKDGRDACKWCIMWGRV